GPIRLVIHYVARDREFRDELHTHLRPLERSKEIRAWDFSQIPAGDPIDSAVLSEIESAEIVLFLVSASFLAIDDPVDPTSLAMRRYADGKLRVVPIIVRPCDYSDTTFAGLQVLPRDGKPIFSHSDRDSAWLEVVKNLRALLRDLRR